MKLKAGDKAPDFVTIDQDGNVVTLKDFLGKKLILFFYHRDILFFTWTLFPILGFKNHYEDFRQEGYEVVGVGVDNQYDHKWLVKYLKLPYRLLTDIYHGINKKYGTFKRAKVVDIVCNFTIHTAFVIDEEGYITEVAKRGWLWGHASRLLHRLKQQRMQKEGKTESNKSWLRQLLGV